MFNCGDKVGFKKDVVWEGTVAEVVRYSGVAYPYDIMYRIVSYDCHAEHRFHPAAYYNTHLRRMVVDVYRNRVYRNMIWKDRNKESQIDGEPTGGRV